MPWKKYFRSANSSGTYSALSSRGGKTSAAGAGTIMKYPNMLQESYMGCPNRIERYQNMESMDQDAEICAALDILAEFSTQSDDKTHLCFDIDYKETPTETESKIIRERLYSWYYLNEFDKRAFKIFRNVLKFGDQIFLRDPETFKLFYVEMDNVIKVIVNESQGKKPEQYVVRNINPNFMNLTVTEVTSQNLYNVIPSGPGYTAPTAGFNMPNTPYSSSSRFSHSQTEHAIEAQHILHLSLTEGLDPNWPFGTSVLESVFKVFKQKELLEDSIIIYRIQRAPERRVFNIDVGEMPSHLAMQYLEKIKNEVHQRRIPGFGEGRNFMDTTYFSLPPNADFYFPKNSCISLNEPIKLLDGRNLPLNEVIKEFEDGKKNYTYSINPKTKLVEVGEIEWAGITRKNAEVLKVTLDDNSSVIVTPDHPFIMRDGTEKLAKNLLENDSLMPWNDFKLSYRYNHKVKSIEWLSERIDTGDIHIKSKSDCHNFALGIGIFVHNSGRGTTVDQLPGGENLDQIKDLLYFNNKMIRALRIPSSYLPTGPDESPATLNDGRLGTALIQEYRFNQYCQRLQKLICSPLDLEFKAYLKWSGVNIDTSMFSLNFNPPQNFAHYRQAELDNTKIATFTQLESLPYFSRRWLMQRFLGMSPDEITENQTLWREENEEIQNIDGEQISPRNIGLTPGGIQTDMDMFNQNEIPEGGEGEQLPGEQAAPGAGPTAPSSEGGNAPGTQAGPQPEI